MSDSRSLTQSETTTENVGRQFDGKQIHIVTGAPYPGRPRFNRADFHSEWDRYEDPMNFGGSDGLFEGPGNDTVQAANLAQASSKDSGDARIDQQMISMSMGNDGDDLINQSDAYGRRPTDGRTL